MAHGFSNGYEAAVLDDVFRTPGTGTSRSLYAYLFKYDGYTAGNGALCKMDDDGTITTLALTDATITSGSTTISSTGGGFTAAMIGMVLDESTGKIPAGTTLTAVASSTSATMSAAATGTVSTTANVKVNAFSLVTGGGFSPATYASADFGSAVGGAPSTKTQTATKSWSASGSPFGEVCWIALHTLNSITTQSGWNTNKATMVSHGPITNSSGTQVSVPVGTGETAQIDSTNPLKFQLGDTTDTFA